MQWNLRLKAAERGIWKSTEMRRLLAEAGLEISAGKMSALWTGTPTSIRLDDLDVICAVLDCDPTALLIREPEKVAAAGRPNRRPARPPMTARPSPRGSTVRARNHRYEHPTARQVRGVPGQPGRVDEAADGLLLQLPARRPVHSAGLSGLRQLGVLQPGIVHALPSRSPAPCRLLPGLLGLGRLPVQQLAVLELPLVVHPLPRRHMRVLRTREPDQRPGRLPTVLGERPPAPTTRPGPQPGDRQPARTAALPRQPPVRQDRSRPPTRRPRPRIAAEAATGTSQDHCRCTRRRSMLFRMLPGRGAIKDRALTGDSRLLRYCEPILREHAKRHAWTRRQTNSVVHTLKLPLDALQDWPGAKILVSDVAASIRYGGTQTSTLEILAAADLLVDDRTTAVEPVLREEDHRSAARDGLVQLQLWFDVMLKGRATVPRLTPTPRADHPPAHTGHGPDLATMGRAGTQIGWLRFSRQRFRSRHSPDPKGPTGSSPIQGCARSSPSSSPTRRSSPTRTRGVPVARSNTTVPMPLDTTKICALPSTRPTPPWPWLSPWSPSTD
ncbi:hypothetical protein SALBM311S_10511 [Streptomyces alboniger]